MSSDRFGEIVLTQGATSAKVSPGRGALVTSFVVAGREALFLDEASFLDPSKNVRGGVPVLFPSPGKLAGDRFVFRGREGRMGQHGFARNAAWSVEARAADAVTLALRDDHATRAVFPYAFAVTLEVRVTDGALHLDATIENTGEEAMPCALGYHPYFVVPQAAKAATRVPTPATRAFDNVTKADVDLALDLDAPEVDLHLHGHTPGHGELVLPDARVLLDGDAAFRRWVVWTLRGRDFVCLEPWTAPGDALNSGTDLFVLGPRERLALPLTVRLVVQRST